jgi:hypothetical protein
MLPPDGYLYTEWAGHQIVLRIRQKRWPRWTRTVRLGIGWKPLRLWLRIEPRHRSKYA